MSLATISLSVNDSDTIKKPMHIIMWQDESVSNLVTSLTSRVEALEKLLSEKEFRTPLISGIDMKRRSDSLDCMSVVLPTSNTAELFKDILDLKTITIAPRMGQDSIMYGDVSTNSQRTITEESEEGTTVEESEEGTTVEESDEAEETEQAEEAEEEEEALELEEFEYKGLTYYRDAELKVYQLDTDGDLDETPIGIWNESKQKVLKYAKA